MKHLTKLQLLKGLSHKNNEVFKAYFEFIAQKWITTNLAPNSWQDIENLLADEEIQKVITKEKLLFETAKALVKVVCKTPGIDFYKIRMLVSACNISIPSYRDFYTDLTVAALTNSEKFPRHGMHRLQKKSHNMTLNLYVFGKISDGKWIDILQNGLLSTSLLSVMEMEFSTKKAFNNYKVLIATLLEEATAKRALRYRLLRQALLVAEVSACVRPDEVNLFAKFASDFPQYRQIIEARFLKIVKANCYWSLQGFVGVINKYAFSNGFNLRCLKILINHKWDKNELVNSATDSFNQLWKMVMYCNLKETGRTEFLECCKSLQKRNPYEVFKCIKNANLGAASFDDMTIYQIKNHSAIWQQTFFFGYSLAVKPNFNNENRAECYFVLLFLWQQNPDLIKVGLSELLYKILQQPWSISDIDKWFYTWSLVKIVNENSSADELKIFVCEGLKKLVSSTNILTLETIAEVEVIAKLWDFDLSLELNVHKKNVVKKKADQMKLKKAKEQEAEEIQKLLAVL